MSTLRKGLVGMKAHPFIWFLLGLALWWGESHIQRRAWQR